jgi:hypothetical protein
MSLTLAASHRASAWASPQRWRAWPGHCSTTTVGVPRPPTEATRAGREGSGQIFNVEYRTEVYAQQRGLEQTLYDQYPEARFENGGFNKIRGISISNPNLPFYMQSAQDFVAANGGG